jgi:mono/diheme cytochrome c family protein
MRLLAAPLTAATVAALAVLGAQDHGPRSLDSTPMRSAGIAPALLLHSAPPKLESDALNEVVDRYCASCHSDTRRTGNLSLEGYDVTDALGSAETSEKIIRKLRAGMMPPPGRRRPQGDSLTALAEYLETTLNEAAYANPDPGYRTFQRLNRAEYEAAVRDLLALEVDAGDWLPLDTKSANFDNIADVQMLSATTLSTYLNAAAAVARLAVGDPEASSITHTYESSSYVTQWDRMEGAPRGTRGGVSVVHTFPADGMYTFRMSFYHTTTGGYSGRVTRGEEIDVSIDGEQVALLAVDRFMDTSDPKGVYMETEPVFVTAGPHRVSAAFLRLNEGPVEDLLSPHEWSLTDRQIGVSGYGITSLGHMKNLFIDGPENPVGVSDTPSRERIFTCHPDRGGEAEACAREIVERIAPRAYRRTVGDTEIGELLGFYAEGEREGGFELGIRTAIQAILASPDFIFRFEEPNGDVGPGDVYALDDFDLASRLSFFLWGSLPDAELLGLAEEGRLADDEVFSGQVDRMLADRRSEALATRFAAQWLRLDDLAKVHPDRLLFPDYYEQLADAMRRETELFFDALVREDRSFFELYSADWTFVNEDLATHYGIPGVVGDAFRRIDYPDAGRRGILGHGSVLTLTSHANRTSPVLRGKWVMEVLMGTPPPPPPPNVPELEESGSSVDGRPLTTREQMELHRESPSCNSCHQYIDPIGLALDNFDVTGRLRIKENGRALDTRGELYDGTPITSAADLRSALLSRPIPLARTFTENLMAYAIGRRMEAGDQPWVRAVTDRAAEENYRMSSFIRGVVESPAFRMQRVPDANATGGD